MGEAMQDFWETSPPTLFASEADVEHQLVVPLLYALGYETANIAPKYAVEFREGRRGRKPEADFVCFSGAVHNRDTSLLVVEAKAPDETLSGGKEQGESYAANLRAPVLVMTNGLQLQGWQLQPTKESEKVIDLAVTDLIANRGKIERLLAKKSLIDLCNQLSVKSFSESSEQYEHYVTAELARISKDKELITRTLRLSDIGQNQKELPSNQLLDAYPQGSVILAPSGFGKSTLANQLFRQALERRSVDREAPLSFLVPLSAIAQGNVSLLQFVQQRLSAHSPGVTLDVLKDLLRVSGAIVLCDAFDRVSSASRTSVLFELSNLVRDFPRVQLILLARESVRPDIELPFFNLTPPSDEELREFELLVLGGSKQSAFVVSMMPKTLRNICENMLVARRVLEYWKENGQYPLQLGLLFRAWMDKLLNTTSTPDSKAVWQESALTLLAEATIDAPISATTAAALLKQNHLEPTVITELIECDAVRANGTLLELQHEALADYLRAQHLASIPESELLHKLSTIAIPQDSLYATLLMAQLHTRQLQSALWKRLSETSIGVYLDALRYRFDLSKEMETLDQQTLSHGYLKGIRSANTMVDGPGVRGVGYFADLAT